MNPCFLNLLWIALQFQVTRSFQPAYEVVNRTHNQLSASGVETNVPVQVATPNEMSTGGSVKNDCEASDGHDGKDVIAFSSTFLSGTTGKHSRTASRTALVILNYRIPNKSLLLEHLWKTSNTRIAADGGANRLYEYSKELIPDRIRGDLDSLNPTVRAYYESQNVSVEQDFCQNSNDLDKALQVLVEENKNADDTNHETPSPSPSFDRVVIYGAFGGRFDQEMASFVALYKWAPRFNGQMYLYSDETCAFLIPAQKECEIFLPFYDIQAPDSVDGNNVPHEIGEGPTCGLIPLGCPCESIVTSGLQWDLDGSIPLEFGGLVSTSNRVMKPIVKIFASHPVVFTAELVSKR
mmetsp:Transcript_27869/g.75819  ORF Transcript_27869/g.75819 Transcript_27869/m.75819 type:complete len:351 (-) Transcript_27869:566-1618(-)